ncbi:hypothetical protein EDD16DRAFT_1673123 [Pisolithus croceorrhizus]|nr:hypothetical protein EDD16DRAFT_1673123 [Pisolithus croceorrhizus]
MVSSDQWKICLSLGLICSALLLCEFDDESVQLVFVIMRYLGRTWRQHGPWMHLVGVTPASDAPSCSISTSAVHHITPTLQ